MQWNEQNEQRLHEDFIKVMRRMRKIKLSAHSEQVLYTEYVAMSIINRYEQDHPGSEGIYVSELASGIETAASAVSRMLKAMEKKGLVRRKVDSKDRRNTYVGLTQEGKTVLSETAGHMEEFRKRLIQGMGNDDMYRLIELWNKLAGIMETEVAALSLNCKKETKKQKRPEGDGKEG